MWALNNRTSYAAGRTWIRDKHGAHHWVVAVKATFDMGSNGKLTLSDEQPPPVLTPEYFGDPGASSVRYDADLGQPKPTTDILINGHAYAPKGKPVPSVDVGFRLGPIQKSLRVFGIRVYYKGLTGLTTSPPRKLTKFPITYEWAYGGTDMADTDPKRQRIDRRNPVGKGVAVRSASLVHQPAHCIEYPTGKAAKLGPAGFGALASFWSPRLEMAGTYDSQWERSRKPLLPLDYDERCVLSAPVDQRPSTHLRGGEQVALLNLTPSGLLQFSLPKIYLTFATFFGSRREEHRGKMCTVLIEPEESKLSVLWQTALPVGPLDVDYLDKTIVEEKPYLS